MAQDKKDDGVVPTQDWIKREDDKKKVATTLEILLLVTVLALAPAILVMVTSFTRIVIVLSFLRRALSTQELPPNQVIIGLSLVLTFLVMSPTAAAIKRDAIDPYMADKNPISQKDAMKKAEGHLRVFMFKQARPQDLTLFMEITKQPKKASGWTEDDVPTEVLIPAFVVGELRRAFIMGFALFLPFLVIDMVIASLLMSMGMFMLPPVLVSLPFKILLFVLVDGWALIVGSLLRRFA
ncbi:MAG: flagellar type III secretion system pore protein FliP [Geobacter sp.]|nr:flagellar type III secretion system pore protein FliP [Geobacter sp.]